VLGPWRYLLAFAVSAVVVFGLFLFMHRMVAFADASLSDRKGMGRIDFVRLRRDSITEKKKRELPQKPSQKQQQPEAPKMNMPSSGGSADSIAVQAPDPGIDAHKVDMGGLDIGSAPSDTEAVPVVRVEPIYPHVAAQRNIEGWVLLEFDIGPQGNVMNPKVIESDPPRIFDEAALNAVKKWKYKPQVKNGKPLITRGITVRLKFALEKQ
jgi:protein TonB